MKPTPSTPEIDDSSLDSESSAAVVSLYNSWSSSGDEGFNNEDDDSSSLNDQQRHLDDISTMTEQELYKELQKRCRPEDIPVTPVLKPPRSRPFCLYINFMGQKRDWSAPKPTTTTTMTPAAPPVQPVECKSEFKLDFEDDADGYLAMIESQSLSESLHSHFDESENDLFDSIVQIHKRPRIDEDESPLSPISVHDEFYFSLY
ncbi:hypothetical protein MPSEU_000904800 [Mayamaea pseudoterrestris]|nr:hypothetical protein MPSEU_000904800 [Mayamaea pseudoterrestris]